MKFQAHFVLTIACVLCCSTMVWAQNDAIAIKRIFDFELSEGKTYINLEYLCIKIGHRLSGSPSAAAAVEWSRQVMSGDADSVWLQPVMVPHWVRGQKEIARVITKKTGIKELNICALGGSIGTGSLGVSGNVIEVKGFDELKTLGTNSVRGKIVFFNRPMDASTVNTFAAYSAAVDQRTSGASEAVKYGAIGVIVRSLGSNPETYPHTGSVKYIPNVAKIPAVAISTMHADTLSALLSEDKDLELYFETHCELLPDESSFNVIGEIRGSEFPNEYIVVSGHLDSWDFGQGAHDDGAGCVQAMEVLRIFQRLGIKPKHSIRAVMYMNEENGLRGGMEYARQAELRHELHIAAIESDRGGFTPRGFSMSAPAEVKARVQAWKSLLSPYGLTDWDQEGGGADIGPLAKMNVPLFGFLPDSQRYFNYHHTTEDTIDKVDRRELALGAASMTALVYLIDSYGLK